MYIVSFVPTMEFALPATAALAVLVIVIEFGKGWGLGTYAAMAALSLLLLPNKFVPLLFAGFFGQYPVTKLMAEKLPRWAEISCKALVFNAGILAAYFAGRYLFGVGLDLLPDPLAKYTGWILLLVGNVTFWVYDIALNRCIMLYTRRLQRRLRKTLGI
ncbi:MAG: hypothetical protein LBR73_07975 [Oscillospiraceae bacterium]|jgi:hypothetical protein|nr:hypothetical protein [Oscillospiraceae bacterium]